jgi:hypothetical protein
MVGRGLSESRRGQALSLTFGAGPILAVIANLGSGFLLKGGIPDPWNFASLFAASMPIFGLGALFSASFIVPYPAVEVPRQPLLGGLLGEFRRFFSYHLILIAVIAYILVFYGNMIIPNISLYTREAIGEPPEKYVDYQNALRFGFKVFAGFFLGWLLIQTNPKTLLLVTAGLELTGVAWALGAPGKWFLLSFGIMGTGELFGVYYPNYILGCSPKSKMRRTMAFTSLVSMPAGLASILFGLISDTFGAQDKKFGYQASFVAAIILLALAILLVLVGLPAHPRPRKSDMDASDLAPEKTDADALTPASA